MRCHTPRGDGRNGDRMRLRRRWLIAERKQSLDTLGAPKSSGAELVKLESLRNGVSNDLPRRARNEHLSAVCCGAYPGRPVDGDANEATADHDRLTRVHAHAHAHRFGKRSSSIARCALAAPRIAAVHSRRRTFQPSPSRSTSRPPWAAQASPRVSASHSSRVAQPPQQDVERSMSAKRKVCVL
jgi:hypothetical protein